MRVPDTVFWLFMDRLPAPMVDRYIEKAIKRHDDDLARAGKPRIGRSRDPERWFRGRRTAEMAKKAEKGEKTPKTRFSGQKARNTPKTVEDDENGQLFV